MTNDEHNDIQQDDILQFQLHCCKKVRSGDKSKRKQIVHKAAREREKKKTFD